VYGNQGYLLALTLINNPTAVYIIHNLDYNNPMHNPNYNNPAVI